MANENTNNKINMPHLGILVTTYCNLNCRKCADLIPRRPMRHYDIDLVKEDLSRILEVVNYIDEILVIGGETLLYPYLSEVLVYLRNIDKVGKIIITTNASIMPSDAILHVIKDSDVLVRVSGYPDFVTPSRQTIVNVYKKEGIVIEDLENMRWFSMGDECFRYRMEDELEQVFQSCAMKDCVSVTYNGDIIFCSRQCAALETDIYPAPYDYEFVKVRNNPNLEEDLKRFYDLKYICTCNYCDGISCATKWAIPTAIQTFNKSCFLEVLSIYFAILENISDKSTALSCLRQLAIVLKSEINCLPGIISYSALSDVMVQCVNDYTHENAKILMRTLLDFINELADDYTFLASDKIPYRRNPLSTNCKNTITVDFGDSLSQADILVTADELTEAAEAAFPLDFILYNRLFVESKMERLKKNDIKCIVCGLSYTQYGILEKELPCPSVNLSIAGNDIPYSLLLAKKAMEICPDIEYVVIPIAFCQGFYDISSDWEAEIPRAVVAKIDTPVLDDVRNFKGKTGAYLFEGNCLSIYDKICDLKQFVYERDAKIRRYLQNEEFFNDIMPMPAFGGLNFDVQALNEGERYASAKITADLNERVCTEDGFKETMRYLNDFLSMEYVKEKKIIFFNPPLTKYLYAGYSDKIKNDYNKKVIPVIKSYGNVSFYDLANCGDFNFGDFSDFEHLNQSGARKLTAIIGGWLKLFD